jgi:hypothetical protein
LVLSIASSHSAIHFYYRNQALGIANVLADGENNFQYTSARIYKETPEYLDVCFSANEVDVHWVIFPNLAGAYQYIVNKKIPVLGVLRTLFRLSNTLFTHGRTNIKDAPLPPLAEFTSAEKVQDETWKRKDGSYITKYDWSAFIRDIDVYGVYGGEFGSWFIRPGRDYFNGDHLKQELTVHRESKTGDAVMLNVVHGSHFQADSKAKFAAGKIWGPWLWYLVCPTGLLEEVVNADKVCRMMAQKKTRYEKLSKSLRHGRIHGSTIQRTNHAAKCLVNWSFLMRGLLPAPLFFSVTTIQAYHRWTRDKTITTPLPQTPMGSFTFHMCVLDLMHFTPGRMALAWPT